jgi:iron complex transport system ATP-binding protein
MNPLIEFKNFSLYFEETQVLKDLNFSLDQGQYLSIIGPNGAGKSTLLKCLPRLHERVKTCGEIFLKNQPLSSYSQKKLAAILGYVPQAGGFIPPYTVLEFVRLSRYPQPDRSRDQEAVNKALAMTSLENLAQRALISLSGGERQKAYLAAALAQETPVLLLDEPSSFLDPRHGYILDKLLKKLNSQNGLTVITVTHDLNHPARSGGLVLVLKEGRILFFGQESSLESRILEEAFDHRFIYLTHPDGRPVVLAQ